MRVRARVRVDQKERATDQPIKNIAKPITNSVITADQTRIQPMEKSIQQ
jgi:hypothetical protein